MRIVPAITNDALIIHTLAEEIWRETYEDILSQEQINFMLNDMYSVESVLDQMSNGHHFFLLVDDLEYLGFASFSATDNPKIYKIHKLYLQSSSQRKGAGRMMIDHLSAEINNLDGEIMELNVNRNNPAFNFYLKLYFQVYKQIDIPYNNYILNDYIMRKSIVKS